MCTAGDVNGDELFLSIVIPFRGNPRHLRECLDSISAQVRAPVFETIIVDDGNESPVSSKIVRAYGFPLRLYRQTSLGVSAARNSGASISHGKVILFVDSDVFLYEDFLENLVVSVRKHPEDIAFQANLGGCLHSLVGRMEDLRLKTTIEALWEDDGHIEYLNTSAFAILKHALGQNQDLFELHAIRGEDTILLSNLLLLGQRPRFVDEAKARHCPRLSITSYIGKHLVIGYHTKAARDTLRNTSPSTPLDRSGRRVMAKRMLGMALDNNCYLTALPLITLAYGLETIGRASHNLFGFSHRRHLVLNQPVDGVRQDELVSIIASHARKGHSLIVTYLTAWSLVEANRDSSMAEALRNFDICYADGMGVVISRLLLGKGRIHKVTANDFIWKLLRQSALMDLPVVIVGAMPDVISKASNLIRAALPSLNLVGFFDGYMTGDEGEELFCKLSRLNPSLVIVGMGQPLQESWVLRCRESLPQSVFLCVGGLFDYISGSKPTPPKWIRKAGFEWLYILVFRPRPFWKRYVFGLPALAILVINACFSKILSRSLPL